MKKEKGEEQKKEGGKVGGEGRERKTKRGGKMERIPTSTSLRKKGRYLN